MRCGHNKKYMNITVIFFSSDNGPSTEALNWLDGKEDLYYGGNAGIFRGHKGSLFEGGIREPAILSYPKIIESGQVSDKLGAMMDVVPTFLEWAGVDASKIYELDGRSIIPMVVHGQESPHDQLFWEYSGQLAVREGNWKLVLDGKLDFTRTQPDRVHLSNLAQDPGERTNLAEQYPEITDRLTQDVQQWFSGLKNK